MRIIPICHIVLLWLVVHVTLCDGKCQLDWNDLKQFLADRHATPTSHVSSPVQTGTSLPCACHKGYSSSRPCKVTCGVDGEFIPDPPCLPVDCGQPPVIAHASAVVTRGTLYSEKIWYTCQTGYVFYTNVTYHCSVSGEWKNDQSAAPLCVPEPDCKTPPKIKNGSVSYNGTRVSDVAVYTCDKSYRLLGMSASICWNTRFNHTTKSATALWMYVPKCQLDCRPPPTPHLGVIQKNYARLVVTKCTPKNIHTRGTCKMESYFLKARENIYPDFSLVGSEVCVGYTFKIKKSVSYINTIPRRSYQNQFTNIHQTDTLSMVDLCRSFCMPYLNGYNMVVSEEHWTYTHPKRLLVSKVIMKYATVALDKVEFVG